MQQHRQNDARSRRGLGILLVALLSGCAQTPVCFVTHSPSIKTIDDTGAVLVNVPSRTTEVCPGSVEIKK